MPEDWQMKTVGAFTGILTPIWAALVGLVLYSLWRLAWAYVEVKSPEDLRWYVWRWLGC